MKFRSVLKIVGMNWTRQLLEMQSLANIATQLDLFTLDFQDGQIVQTLTS